MKSSSTLPTPASTTTSLDPVLSWGSSVNISEDLRRTIRAECEHLDASIAAVTSQTNAESRKTQSLAKDLKFSEREMRDLARGGNEEVEGCIMNGTVCARMKDQLQSEVGRLLYADSVSPRSTAVDENNLGQKCTTNVDDAAQNQSDGLDTLTSYLAGRKAEFASLAAQHKEKAVAIHNIQAQTKEIDKWTQSCFDRISGEHLLKERSAMSDEVDGKKRELSGEKSKMRSMLEQVQRSRTRSGEHAQQIADLNKQIVVLKETNIQEERALGLQRDAIREMDSALQTELSRIQSRLCSLKDTLAVHRHFNDEVKSTNEHELDIKNRRGEISKETKALLAKQMTLEEGLQDVNRDHNNAYQMLQKALKDQEQLEKEVEERNKSENDENGTIRLAKMKRMSLAEEKIELARRIESLAKEEESKEDLALKREYVEVSAELNAVTTKHTSMKEEYIKCNEHYDDIQQKLNDLESVSAEIESLNKFSIDRNAANNTEKEKLKELQKDFDEEKLRHYNNMEGVTKHEAMKAQSELILLKEAVSYLEHARSEEIRLCGKDYVVSKTKEEITRKTELNVNVDVGRDQSNEDEESTSIVKESQMQSQTEN